MGCTNSVHLRHAAVAQSQTMQIPFGILLGSHPEQKEEANGHSREIVEQPNYGSAAKPNMAPGGGVVLLPVTIAVAVEQPTLSLPERPLPVLIVEASLPSIRALDDSLSLPLRRRGCGVPFDLSVTLVKPALLTEVEVVTNQSEASRRRLEVHVDGRLVAVGPLLDSSGLTQPHDVAMRSQLLSKCRLPLDEPFDGVKTFIIRIVGALAVSRDGEDTDGDVVLIQEVIPRGLPIGSAFPRRRLLRPPSYWSPPEIARETDLFNAAAAASISGPCLTRRVDVTSTEHVEVFQDLLDRTWKSRSTRDRLGQLPSRLVVKKVQRVEALVMWNRFSRERRRMGLRRRGGRTGCTRIEALYGDEDKGRIRTSSMCEANRDLFGSLDAPVNEQYLFHGASPAGALGIIRDGFDLGRAGQGHSLLFGPGAYFAESSSKADEYAQPDEFSGLCAMLVCRVLCGELYRALSRLDADAILKPSFAERYDGVLGDREALAGTYREFVIFSREQAYPEYIVIYDRQYKD